MRRIFLIALMMILSSMFEAAAFGSTCREFQRYKTVKGDTLWQISLDANGSGAHWREIKREDNKEIKNPKKMPVGVNLLIPIRVEKETGTCVSNPSAGDLNIIHSAVIAPVSKGTENSKQGMVASAAISDKVKSQIEGNSSSTSEKKGSDTSAIAAVETGSVQKADGTIDKAVNQKRLISPKEILAEAREISYLVYKNARMYKNTVDGVDVWIMIILLTLYLMAWRRNKKLLLTMCGPRIDIDGIVFFTRLTTYNGVGGYETLGKRGKQEYLASNLKSAKDMINEQLSLYFRDRHSPNSEVRRKAGEIKKRMDWMIRHNKLFLPGVKNWWRYKFKDLLDWMRKRKNLPPHILINLRP